MRRSLVLKRFLNAAFSPSSKSTPPPIIPVASSTVGYSLPFFLSPRRNAVSVPTDDNEAEKVVFTREGPEISCGLISSLAAKGVIVKDEAFQNLESLELQEKGASAAESLSGLPVHVRGNVLGGGADVSEEQFSELLKQVTDHISSISNIFVHDGAVGSSSECDAKVRVISDCPSAALSLSKFLWKTPSCAVSDDSCLLTVYVATSISAGAGDAIGLEAGGANGFIAADIERSSLILCGKAFSDTKGTKEALAALSGPIISAQGGLPLSARLLLSGDAVILLFAPEELIQSCSDMLVSADEGIILSSQGVAPLCQTGDSAAPNLFKLPAAVILATSDSSGVVPLVSKVSPGQAAYYFLAGYQDGEFFPAYSRCLSSIDPLVLAKALLTKLEENHIPSFIINASEAVKRMNGIAKLVQSTLARIVPPFQPKGDLLAKIKTFLSGKFQELPKDLSF